MKARLMVRRISVCSSTEYTAVEGVMARYLVPRFIRA
jgi:hypothetical protein